MLIVGLGNPGKEYEKTRHNIGYMFIDHLANELNVKFKKSIKHQGEIAECNICGNKCILLKPTTYMNLSGISVQSVANYYKIDNKDIFIIVDDLDLPAGKIRIKKDGSSGGHNGLKSIFSSLNTTEIPRMRIGISNNKSADTKDYVLGRFSKEDQNAIDEKISKIKTIIEEYIQNDLNYVMNKYNGD